MDKYIEYYKYHKQIPLPMRIRFRQCIILLIFPKIFVLATKGEPKAGSLNCSAVGEKITTLAG